VSLIIFLLLLIAVSGLRDLNRKDAADAADQKDYGESFYAASEEREVLHFSLTVGRFRMLG
jgi:hypothetical protein